MSSTLEQSMWMREKFTRLLRWAAGPVALALALVGCGGGETVSSTVTAPAQLDQVAALTLAQQSVNARIALPHIVALAAVSSGTASEDFESGMADWQNWGNAQVLAGVGSSGSKAMQVGTGAGGGGLSVPGIVPGTAYRLTAQVRVSDPSETVFIGINMLSSSGDQVIGQSSGPVTGTGFATVTVDLVAPANSASAVVWVWKNAGTGFGYVDDVVFGPAASPPPPPPAPPDTNLLSNGGFESGMTDWVNWDNASVVSGQASSGTSALSVGTAAGGAGHDVGGIVPGTIYRLVAQAKVSDPSETVFVGVNLLNQAGTPVAQQALTVSSTSYSTVSFDITAPSDAVKAVVYVWKNAGSDLAYVDDFVFGVAPGSAPPPPPPSGNLVANGGFESGLASWDNWGNAGTSTTQAAAGALAAQVGTGAGGFGQNVAGVIAGKTYRLSALAKVSSAGEAGYLGVRFMDDAGTNLLERNVAFSSTAYANAQLELVAPANATRALVYVWKNAGSGFAYVDEVALVQVQRVPLSVTAESVQSFAPGRDFSSPNIARLTTGGYVIAWATQTAADPPGTPPTLCFQRYDSSGARAGDVACVNGAQTFGGPLLVARANGGFTIAWVHAGDTPDLSVLHWQDFDAAGNAQGVVQSGPPPLTLTAKSLAGGGFVKLLQPHTENDPVSFQLYAADGTPIGSPQPVADTARVQGAIAPLAGGGFAVAFLQRDGAALVGMTRAFSADGAPLGAPVALGPNTLGPVNCGRFGTVTICPPFQNLAGLTATDEGGYIVAWVDGTGIGIPGDSFARQFRANGSPASAVIGRIGSALNGPIATVSPDAFVMVITGNGITALHVVAAPLR
jgi:hypothetical protein